MKGIYIYRERETDRQTDRDRDRQRHRLSEIEIKEEMIEANERHEKEKFAGCISRCNVLKFEMSVSIYSISHQLRFDMSVYNGGEGHESRFMRGHHLKNVWFPLHFPLDAPYTPDNKLA